MISDLENAVIMLKSVHIHILYIYAPPASQGYQMLFVPPELIGAVNALPYANL